jgi:hypothetical protein
MINADKKCETCSHENCTVCLLRHPVISQCYDVTQAIEECGASEKLTAAVIKSGALMDRLHVFVEEYYKVLEECDKYKGIAESMKVDRL